MAEATEVVAVVVVVVVVVVALLPSLIVAAALDEIVRVVHSIHLKNPVVSDFDRIRELELRVAFFVLVY